MKILRSKKARVVAISTLLSIFGAVGAYAYWTAGGTGAGTADTGTSTAVGIVQTSVVNAMGPGVAAQPLAGTFTADAPTYVAQVTAAVDGTTLPVGCTSADYVIVQPTATNAEVTTGSTWSGGSIAFLNDPARNQDACQDVLVGLNYTSV
jgi:hypothetical protein